MCFIEKGTWKRIQVYKFNFFGQKGQLIIIFYFYRFLLIQFPRIWYQKMINVVKGWMSFFLFHPSRRKPFTSNSYYIYYKWTFLNITNINSHHHIKIQRIYSPNFKLEFQNRTLTFLNKNPHRTQKKIKIPKVKTTRKKRENITFIFQTIFFLLYFLPKIHTVRIISLKIWNKISINKSLVEKEIYYAIHNLHKKKGKRKEHVRVSRLAYGARHTIHERRNPSLPDPVQHFNTFAFGFLHWIIKFDNETIDFSTVLENDIFLVLFLNSKWVELFLFPSFFREMAFYSTHILLFPHSS